MVEDFQMRVQKYLVQVKAKKNPIYFANENVEHTDQIEKNFVILKSGETEMISETVLKSQGQTLDDDDDEMSVN